MCSIDKLVFNLVVFVCFFIPFVLFVLLGLLLVSCLSQAHNLSTTFPSSILVSINSYLCLLICPSLLKINIILLSGNHQTVCALVYPSSSPNLVRTSSYFFFLISSPPLILSTFICHYISRVSLFLVFYLSIILVHTRPSIQNVCFPFSPSK